MKKLFIITILSGMAALTFMSNQGGAATGSPGDRTGRTNASLTCRGCHTGATYGNVVIAQEVKDAGGSIVTSYIPGMTYTITLTIAHTSGSPAGFAFQWASVKTDNVTQAGTPTTTQAGTAVHTLNARKYVEQSTRLSTNTVTFEWVAPPAGTGNVKTVFVGMAVNGNNNDGANDTCSPSANVVLSEVVSTDRIETATASLKIVPNPVTDLLRLKVNAIEGGDYTVEVADLNGRIIATERANFNSGDNALNIDVNHCAAGIYAVRLVNAEGVQATATMVKK